MDFGVLDQKIDIKAKQREVEESAKNGGGRGIKIEPGTYTVKMENLELGVTKKDNAPMMTVSMKILRGEHKNFRLYMNRKVYGTKNDGNMINSALTWLKSLGAVNEDGKPYDYTFTGYKALSELIMDIYEAIDDMGLTYRVEYDDSKFNSITIKDIIDPD